MLAAAARSYESAMATSNNKHSTMPLVDMSVALGGGRERRLVVLRGQDPGEAVDEFVASEGLPDAARDVLL